MGDICQRVGRNVARIRNAAAISQRHLEYVSGIDRGYISGVERGVRNPSLRSLERIARALGVDPQALLAKDDVEGTL